MKRPLIAVFFVLIGILSSRAQDSTFYPQPEYYRASGHIFAKAFEARSAESWTILARESDSLFAACGDRALALDRFYAGRYWASGGHTDSAFADLIKAARIDGFTDTAQARRDALLFGWTKDCRWQTFFSLTVDNLTRTHKLTRPILADSLKTVLHRDQYLRVTINSVRNRYGPSSAEMSDLLKQMVRDDSLDLRFVDSVVKLYGWPGPAEVGHDGDLALFLVIQHSDPVTQERYFPLLKEAAKRGAVAYSEIAMLEDRILMHQGKKQTYGSQIVTDNATGKMKIYPIEDEVNVDQRRASVGLQPMKFYAALFGINYVPPQK